jgi:hypothetical protein
MRHAAAAACAALLFAGSACTIGPAGGADGGGGGTSTSPAQTVGDQCEDVLTEFCTKANEMCAIDIGLQDCINNYMALCCTGSACDQTSTISEATVTECKQTIDGEDCNIVVNTVNPGGCLQSS